MPAVDFTLKRIPNKKAVKYNIVIGNQAIAQNIPIGVPIHLYLADDIGQVIESTIISVQDKKLEFEEEENLLNESNNTGC
jgi:hypothetical protein